MTEINLPSSNNTCVKCNATKRTFTAYSPGREYAMGKLFNMCVCACVRESFVHGFRLCATTIVAAFDDAFHCFYTSFSLSLFFPLFFQCQKYFTRIAWTIKFRNEPQILYLWETASRASVRNSLSTFFLFAYVSAWVRVCACLRASTHFKLL